MSRMRKVEYGTAKGWKRYVVSQIRGYWLLLLFTPILLIPLLAFPKIISQAWLLPLMTASYGVVGAISAVQPWLRRLSSFWLALPVVFVVNLLVGHRMNTLLAPQSRGELKGASLLAILVGYAVGVPTFLALRTVLPLEKTTIVP